MKNISLFTILLFFAVFTGTFLILSFGSPTFSGKASETEPVFSIQITDFQSPVKLGEFLEFSYITRSISGVNGTAKLNFWIEKEGAPVSSVPQGSDIIFLGNLEEKTRTAKIFLPSDFESGIYELIVEVEYGGYDAHASRTIEMNVKGGFATINSSLGGLNIYILSALVLLAILNIYVIYHLEKKKIKKILQKEEQFVKRHGKSILIASFFIILGILVYYLDLNNLLPGRPVYYYSSFGILLLLVLFLEKSKKVSKNVFF